MRTVLRWLASNFWSMVLALILSLLAWFVAVEAQDPTRSGAFPQPIQTDCNRPGRRHAGVGPVGSSPSRSSCAPPSRFWRACRPPDFSASVDLSGLGPGAHEVPVAVVLGKQPTRLLLVEPASVTVELDAQAQITVPVRVEIAGEPALGYLQRAPASPRTKSASAARRATSAG